MSDLQARTATGMQGAYASQTGDLTMSSTRNILRDEFNGSGSGLSAVDATKWDVTIGSGMAITAANSTLQVSSGTTANSQTQLVSKAIFNCPYRCLMAFKQSVAKQANQAIRLEAVSLKADGTLDELNKIVLETQTAGVTTTLTTVTTYSDGIAMASSLTAASFTNEGLWELGYDPDQLQVSVGTQGSATSTNSRVGSLIRDTGLPDPMARMKMRITIINDVSFAGVSNTYTLYHAMMMDLTEAAVEITGGRGYGVNVPVQVTNNLGVFSSPTAGTGGSTTRFKRVSTADTNSALVAGSASAVCTIQASNNSASWRYLKLFNKATAPTVGTDVPDVTIGIPPNDQVMWDMASYMRLGTGLSLAITGLAADLDTTAIGAGEVVVNILRV